MGDNESPQDFGLQDLGNGFWLLPETGSKYIKTGSGWGVTNPDKPTSEFSTLQQAFEWDLGA